MRRKGKEGKDVLAEEPQIKKWVNEDESMEFIKTLKRSEYSIFEQLKKLPA